MPEQTHTTTLSLQTVDETVVERHGGTKMRCDSPEGGLKTNKWWVCVQLRGEEKRRSVKRNLKKNQMQTSVVQGHEHTGKS